MMADLKTRPNNAGVEASLEGVADEQRRQDSYTVLELMREVTGTEPRMWGDSIVGFGSYHYQYASGREGDWFLTGFAPRKQALTLYIMSGFDEYAALLDRLGRYTTDKSCLYVKRLEDVDLPTLRELIRQSLEHVAQSNE
jgi:hypothetical protein